MAGIDLEVGKTQLETEIRWNLNMKGGWGAYFVCQRDFPNDLSSICIVADVDPQLEFGRSENNQEIVN